jgi:hypothetical protein
MWFVVVQRFFVNTWFLPHSHFRSSPLLIPELFLPPIPCSFPSPDHHAPWPVYQGYHPCLAFFPSVASPDLQATIFTFGAVIVTPLYISSRILRSLYGKLSDLRRPFCVAGRGGRGETEIMTYVVAVGPSILNCGFLTTNVQTSSHDLYIDRWPWPLALFCTLAHQIQ